MPTSPQVICLTPVRNEAPRLANFLAAAATWADAIVVADQGSTDGSRQIAADHPKVVLVDNPGVDWDEGYRQRLLLDCARTTFSGPRVVIALDADEALTADAAKSRAWQEMLAAPSGTALKLPWLNLLPGGRQAWVPPRPKRFGLVDDGSEAAGGLIHTGRLPVGSGSPLVMGDVGVVHLQLLDWPGMKAKQRWYQAWERIHFPEKRPVEIYRRYHWMDTLPHEEIVPVENRWLAGYRAAGIDLVHVESGNSGRRDAAVLELMSLHGPETFRHVDLWDHDWTTAAHEVGCSVPANPHRSIDRWVLRFLAATQAKRRRFPVRVADKALALAGW